MTNKKRNAEEAGNQGGEEQEKAMKSCTSQSSNIDEKMRDGDARNQGEEEEEEKATTSSNMSQTSNLDEKMKAEDAGNRGEEQEKAMKSTVSRFRRINKNVEVKVAKDRGDAGQERAMSSNTSLVASIDREIKVEYTGNGDQEEQEKATENNSAPAVENDLKFPNNFNGFDFDTYSWGQSLREVRVSVPLAVEIETMGPVNYILTENYLEVGLAGEAPILAGNLFQSIEVDRSTVILDNKKRIYIKLIKADPVNWPLWKCLMKGEPEIDISKIIQRFHLRSFGDFSRF